MKNKFYSYATFLMASFLLVGCSGAKKNSDSSQSETKGEVYTITFNPCNGNSSDIIKIKGTTGTEVTLPACPNRNGLTFKGWSYSYDTVRKMGSTSNIISSYTIEETNKVFYACYSSAQASQYVEQLKKTSEDNHLYYHYLRYKEDYSNWDVWAWAYKPSAGEGAKHDWVKTGNVFNSDKIGGAYVDIDLAKTYYGGWDAKTKQFLNQPVTYTGATQIGLQIVQTETRTSSSGFWTNDGSNLYVTLEDYKVDLGEGKYAYHIFVVQDNVQEPSVAPATDIEDPFANDDGTNTTYGNSAYDNVNWSSTEAKTETSSDFKSVGVGYQIMVSSFADSDGDGFGDIYGITKKLDYLQKLGVKAIWLTPIQLSDSYHGYDITDYETVDPKFGSSVSPAAVAHNGEVSEETAMADYRELIETAHAKGIKVVMDLVLNHTSTSNKWFVKSANLNTDYRGYYQWGNHLTTSGKINQANSWYPYGDHPYSFYAKFGSSMPELNFSYKTTREAVEDMSAFWVKEVGVDGFRLDAVKHIYMSDETTTRSGDTIVKDVSASGNYSSNITKNLHFFRELKSKVKTKSGKNVFFVGENFDGHAYHVSPYYEAFDSMFDFYAYFNLTSAAATGRKNTTSAFGTASGFMKNGSTYTPKTTGDPKDVDCENSTAAFNSASGSAWNYPSVYNTYNTYRGDTSLPGLFTSNHDIARVINRIAGGGTPNGIDYQGNITTSNYDSFEQSANCVKIAELMFPGLTWVYYGDEIGMTGNFPAGTDSKSDYSDLWYRQPMKWTADQTGEYMTDYYVTGSNMKVGWDDINKSSVVVPANTQMNQENSQYGIMKKFINLKTANNDVAKTLILGSISAADYANGNLAANVLSFSRTYGSTTIKVAINFNGSEVNANSLEGTVIATYNTASQSKLGAYSAIIVKA